MNKKCRNCGEEKPLIDFPKSRTNKDGYDSLCKTCTNIYAKQRRLNKIVEERKRNQLYKEKNKLVRLSSGITEKQCVVCFKTKLISEFSINDTNKDGYINKCKNCVNEYNKNYRDKNKEKENVRVCAYYESHKNDRKKYFNSRKDIITEYSKEYRVKNKKEIKEKRKIYYTKNKSILSKKNYEYYKNRLKTDKNFKLRKEIHLLIYDCFRKRGLSKNNRKSIEILGCSVKDFKLYLESKFEPWMTWDNKGLYNGELNFGWDIDHIVPISTARTEDDIIKLNHYTNLQPLCSYTNRYIKIAKI